MDERIPPGQDPADPSAPVTDASAGSRMKQAAKALGCLVLAALVFFIALVIGVFDAIL